MAGSVNNICLTIISNKKKQLELPPTMPGKIFFESSMAGVCRQGVPATFSLGLPKRKKKINESVEVPNLYGDLHRITGVTYMVH